MFLSMNAVRGLYGKMSVPTSFNGSESLAWYGYNKSKVRAIEADFLRRVCGITKYYSHAFNFRRCVGWIIRLWKQLCYDFCAVKK